MNERQETCMENKILIGIIGVCVLLLVIGIVRNRMELFVNLVLRTVMGIVGIYIVNEILATQNIQGLAGINGITAAIVAVLGFPGFLLIYGIGVYHMMF